MPEESGAEMFGIWKTKAGEIFIALGLKIIDTEIQYEAVNEE